MVTYTSGREREPDSQAKYVPWSTLKNPNTMYSLNLVLGEWQFANLQKNHNEMLENIMKLTDKTSPQFLDNMIEFINLCQNKEMFENALDTVIDRYLEQRDSHWLNVNIISKWGYFPESLQEFTNDKQQNKNLFKRLFKWNPEYLRDISPFEQLKNKGKELWSPEQKLFDILLSHTHVLKSALFENKEWRFSWYWTGFHWNKVKKEIQSYFSNDSESLDKIQSAFDEHKTVVFRFDPDGTYFNVMIRSEGNKGKIYEDVIYSSDSTKETLLEKTVIGM